MTNLVTLYADFLYGRESNLIYGFPLANYKRITRTEAGHKHRLIPTKKTPRQQTNHRIARDQGQLLHFKSTRHAQPCHFDECLHLMNDERDSVGHNCHILTPTYFL